MTLLRAYLHRQRCRFERWAACTALAHAKTVGHAPALVESVEQFKAWAETAEADAIEALHHVRAHR